MRFDDVDAVVSVHLAAFPGFFLSFLGPRFLQELYRAVIADEDCLAFVAASGDRLIGFVAGTASAEFWRRARRRWLRFGAASLPALLRRPSIARRLVRALAASHGPRADGARLMSLAVVPEARRSGVGTELTRAFIQAARAGGAAAIVLTTDEVDNLPVRRFYRARGFVETRTYVTPEGRSMCEYTFMLINTGGGRVDV